MAKNSGIEWTDHTFNPWVGCQKVSEGCKFCYAERDMTRRERWRNSWGPPETSARVKTKTWAHPIRWNKQAEKEGVRYRVFCASLADVFESGSQLDEWREELWDLIESTPNLDWLLLTKRPANVNGMVPPEWRNVGSFPAHVWVGTSVENRITAEERIPHLARVPANGRRFLSVEPLLGPVDNLDLSSISWVIAGGESGLHARPMHPAWARSIQAQCHASGIHFYFKQWGRWCPNNGTCDEDTWFKSRPKYLMSPLGSAGAVPDSLLGAGDVLMSPVGKKKAGRLLMGKEWTESPV